ncbi:MAG: hypothetical protein NZ570_01760 [Candidatus Caldarchaeum sp.]|nr:hypothetical protein [Candidatus Caldarchaeum sp.]MDW8360535.1 hypothetical protein [Candidatus Caldarchaeum sp.]
MEAQDPTVYLLAIASFFFLTYLLGSFFGRRRVAKLNKTFSEIISSSGGRVVGGRSGATAAILSCKNLGNLAEFSIVVGIQSWANPLSYLVSKMMGRGDLAVLRARLTQTPTFSYTLIRKDAPARRYAAKWGRFVREINGYILATPEKEVDDDVVSKTIQTVNRLDNLLLLSVNRELPHLQAYFVPSSSDSIKNLLYVLIKLI